MYLVGWVENKVLLSLNPNQFPSLVIMRNPLGGQKAGRQSEATYSLKLF